MTHHGKSKYATTSLVVTRDQITRKQDKITDQIILDAVNRKLTDYRRAVAAIDGAEYYSADDLWEAVNDILKGGNRTPFHLDIFEFGRDKMAAMEPKTAEGYQTSLNALMKVRSEPEAERLIERYRGTDGKHLLNFHTRYSDHRNFNNMVNKGLKKLAEAVNTIAEKDKTAERIPEGLNFYYARHTWSTLAMNACGIDFDTVHQSLNHARRGADRVTGIYVEQDYTKAWEANRKVLDLLK